MRKSNIIIMLLLSLTFTGCGSAEVDGSVQEDIVTVPNIEIIVPNEIDIVILKADPIYLDRDTSQETILSIKCNVKNNSDISIKGTDYSVSIRCYGTDGTRVFEWNEGMLFNGTLDPGTNTIAYYHSEFINGTEYIDKLVLEIK